MKKLNLQSVRIQDIISKEQFGRIAAGFLRNFKLPVETTDINGQEIRSLCSSNCHPAFCQRIRLSKTGLKRCREDRVRSLNISIETGQPYITLCHAGIVLGCIPVMDGNIPLGGLFFGKCLWEPLDETIESDVQKRLRGLHIHENEIRQTLLKVPVVSARRIHEASEFLYVLLYQTADLDPQVIQWRRQRSMQQAQISQTIQETKLLDSDEVYPYELECQLIGKVKIGDRTGAKEILNSLLGRILFHNPGNINLLKARLVELLSVLSRAAAQGGVDINLLLNKNMDYINKVLALDTQEDICIWISHALDEFIESVYNSQDAQKMSQLKPAIEFMQYHYSQPLTLADIAKSAHLSVSRLAHLFREQMGVTIVDYLTSIRIQHAKRLLLTSENNCTRICYEVGYNNQSYFTRVFKQLVGMTPREFRRQNKR
ncbi:MAG TPA: PocR ligand-binding domain-containing protein [Anaerohalosphaeraceae bacterium]|nr:PocR ligand-binding domain-containing protein [Phycisphaerae bacterium]HOL32258.1 PocR ligand-binding domain-containing protein [Anaerohalosphaeraceae bacterium]HOM76826.1 PocR ligand-binding domain-containing protein [Anaerohalosphaeraceae bacterium]HPC64892.1 PocR ligand-binding domain-containing protein [Anaerohalosphaeraceae bacterium]HPO69209.1 PocR ligand-binding domain-containing protein [Anaerohalosphaeraceae bacterium]